MGRSKFNVNGEKDIVNTDNTFDIDSIKKLKYLNTNKMPIHTQRDMLKMSFLYSCFCSINKAAIHETIVVKSINTTYLGFQHI